MTVLTHCAQPGSRADGLLDLVLTIAGAILALFVCMHMVFLSSILFGANALNALAGFLDSIHAESVGAVVISVVFVAHATAAARRIPFKAGQAFTIARHARLLHHEDTWRWVVQVLTAFVLLFLVTIHLWEGFTVLPVAAIKSAIRVQHAGRGWFYLILMPVLFVHLALGMWRLGVKWGFIGRAERAAANKYARYFFFGIFGYALLTLVRFWTLTI